MAATDRRDHLGRSALVALGRTLVTSRFETAGCTVEAPERRGETFKVRTPSGRVLQMYMSTQRVGGYVFWPKRRFNIATDLVVTIVVIDAAPEPDVYLIPSTEWLDAKSPFTDRPNIGKRSEPEYGVSVSRSSLPTLERFLWTEPHVNAVLGEAST